MPRLTLDRLADLRTYFLADDLPCTEEMCAWTEEQASAYYESGGEVLPDVRCYPRVWLTSDVHTDRENNMAWCKKLPKHPHGDVLIVAGDLSHRLEIIEETLTVFTQRFTRVYFIPGNHDLWMNNDDPPGSNSVDKIHAIIELCDRLGVSTRAELLGENGVVLEDGFGRVPRPAMDHGARLIHAVVQVPSAMVSGTVSAVTASVDAVTSTVAAVNSGVHTIASNSVGATVNAISRAAEWTVAPFSPQPTIKEEGSSSSSSNNHAKPAADGSAYTKSLQLVAATGIGGNGESSALTEDGESTDEPTDGGGSSCGGVSSGNGGASACGSIPECEEASNDPTPGLWIVPLHSWYALLCSRSFPSFFISLCNTISRPPSPLPRAQTQVRPLPRFDKARSRSTTARARHVRVHMVRLRPMQVADRMGGVRARHINWRIPHRSRLRPRLAKPRRYFARQPEAATETRRRRLLILSLPAARAYPARLARPDRGSFQQRLAIAPCRLDRRQILARRRLKPH